MIQIYALQNKYDQIVNLLLLDEIWKMAMWFQVSNKSCAEIKELNNPCHTGFYSFILSQQMQYLVNDGENEYLPGLVFLQCSLGGTWASHTNYTEVMTQNCGS